MIKSTRRNQIGLPHDEPPLVTGLIKILRVVKSGWWNQSDGNIGGPLQFQLLQLLVASPGHTFTISDCAKLLAVKHATISETAITLQKRKMVSRFRSSRDARVVHINITEFGQHALHTQITQSPLYRALQDTLSTVEQEQLLKIVTHINHLIDTPHS
jgi:DNA-binding MarR family transcriptional regulator